MSTPQTTIILVREETFCWAQSSCIKEYIGSRDNSILAVWYKLQFGDALGDFEFLKGIHRVQIIFIILVR